MNIDKLLATLQQAEGEVLHVYKDSLGYDTIGIGHLIKVSERGMYDGGITHEQALEILQADLQPLLTQLPVTFSWFNDLDDVRQRVITEMAFNMGLHGLCQFHNTLKAVEDGRYDDAANGMLASLWASQVKGRASRMAQMMSSGEDPS